MNLQEAPLVIGIVSLLVPVVAVYLRGRSPMLAFTMLFAALAVAAHLFALLRLAQIGPTATPNAWVYFLFASSFPVLLASYILSITIGRERNAKALVNSRRTFVLLGIVGAALLLLLRNPAFIAAYNWNDGKGTIYFGAFGKAYLSYLLLGLILIGYNLEKTYRIAPSGVRHHLRIPFLAFFGLMAFLTFIITTGLLYSSMGLGKLFAAGMPLALANVLIGHGFLRGGLSDIVAPVSRTIVYSSFTAMAAALYVLAVGIVAQIATFTNWSPDEVVTLSLGFLTALIAILLLFSNRFQRSVRRFIDRNFYVNRYDYRTQWSNVALSLDRAVSREEVLRSCDAMLRDVFLADKVTIALLDNATMSIKPHLGEGADNQNIVLEKGSPLFERLSQERRTLLLDRHADDFEYIPIYAENRAWLKATASRMTAPLLDGAKLVGALGLERKKSDDPFTFEDVALMDSIAVHVSSALRGVQLAEELAESREMGVVSHWSNMLLHDLKNYLTPLRLVAQNMRKYKDRPDIAEIASKDIDHVAERMETLVLRLGKLRENPELLQTEIDLDRLVQTTVEEMKVGERTTTLDLALNAQALVVADESMIKRVVENLVTNAIEAMNGDGKLRIATSYVKAKNGDSPQVQLVVRDNGIGIAADFLRERLFRPFATTKKQGLGLGLYQCRSIIRAHAGELTVNSTLGDGAEVCVTLPVGAATSQRETDPSPRVLSNGAVL